MLISAKNMAYSCILLLCCFSRLWSSDEVIYFQNSTGLPSSDEWQFTITGGINRNWKTISLKGFQSSLNITELQNAVGPIIDDNVTGIEISTPPWFVAPKTKVGEKICHSLGGLEQCETIQAQASYGCLSIAGEAGCSALKTGKTYI